MNKCKTILYEILRVLALFFAVFFVYYLCNISYTISAFKFGYLTIGILIIYLVYCICEKKLDKKRIIFMILALGILLRMIYGGYNNIFSRQHDVGKANETGHYGYALYIYRNGMLPDTNIDQFYQPPLNAWLQAKWMKLFQFILPIPEHVKDLYLSSINSGVKFKYNNDLLNYFNSLYNSCRILGTFYSSITLLLIYKILKEFKLKDYTLYIILLVMATQPVLVMMSGTMNNDNLSYVFFFSALLFAIRWFKKQTYIDIVLVAISIGLGMITKLSIGFIALVIGPMMLVKLIQRFKEKTYLKLLPQFVVFAMIVFPLGLSYAIRNYLLFNQGLTYILDFGRDSWLHAVIKEKNIFERFFSLPISQLIHKERGIFHDYQEYNIWVDLIKTSIFEEFSYNADGCVLGALMYLIIVPYWLLLIPVIIYIINRIIKKTYTGDMMLTIICLALVILALFSYVSLCVKMPYGCTSNFRYISYISFAMIVLYALALEHTTNTQFRNACYLILSVFAGLTTLFILVI